MKRSRYVGLVILAIALSSLGCFCGGIDFGAVRFGWPGAVRGSGQVVEEERPVRDISGVELATFGDLTIELGQEEQLLIEAEDNLIPYFETEMRGGILVISQRPNVRLVSNRPVNFYLTVRRLETIELSASGDVAAPSLEAEDFSTTLTGSGDMRMGDLEAEAVKVRLTGSGDLRMGNLDADRLEVRIGGSGDMATDDVFANAIVVDMTGSGNLDVAGGHVEEQEITITGSGNYHARDMQSTEADVQLSGSGSATLQVQEYLDAGLTGSGDVRYAGSPTVESSSAGSGDMVRIGD